jgi:CubicO group peptidase (beta-lactamase class C family)
MPRRLRSIRGMSARGNNATASNWFAAQRTRVASRRVRTEATSRPVLARVAYLLLLFSAAASAAPPSDLDAFANRALKTFGAPGMGVTIVEGDRVIAKGYGIRKVGESERVDAHTLFPIGSNTKAFTSAALAILIEEGKLSWDDRVVDKLPGFRLYDAYATQEMTIRDLLTHRSGLGLGAGDLLFFPPTNFTRAEIVERLRYIKPATSFRSGYAYDNVLYIVAGQLIEHVSGMPWESFVQERVLAPLGMSDSSTSAKSAKPELRAWLHGRFDGPIRGVGTLVPLAMDISLDNAGPAGSIQASATDMAKWLQVQLDRGVIKANGKRLFSQKNAEEMWTPVTLIPVEPRPPGLEATAPTFDTYALGWDVRDYKGHKLITHGGAVEGGLSVTAMFPDRKVGIAVMINSEDGAARSAVLYRLLDHYLDQKPTDWISVLAKAREKMIAGALEQMKQQPGGEQAAADSRGPSLPLAQYAGTYKDAWYGTIQIKSEAAGLRISFDRTLEMEGALEHVRYDTFRTRWTNRRIEDAYVTFALRPDGSIDQMKMQAISPLADFSFDYQDLLFTRVDQK